MVLNVLGMMYQLYFDLACSEVTQFRTNNVSLDVQPWVQTDFMLYRQKLDVSWLIVSWCIMLGVRMNQLLYSKWTSKIPVRGVKEAFQIR